MVQMVVYHQLDRVLDRIDRITGFVTPKSETGIAAQSRSAISCAARRSDVAGAHVTGVGVMHSFTFMAFLPFTFRRAASRAA
jgi:hypothetical protein